MTISRKRRHEAMLEQGMHAGNTDAKFDPPPAPYKAQEWRSINSAPRDGTIIEVMDEDCGSFAMRWNPSGHNPIFQKEYGNGIWECPGNNFTWSEDEGCGPTYWRPLDAVGPSPDGASK